ncbi:MAG: hypothetical protein ACJ8KU_02430 [Chthoniobacterales bacterium]
MKRRLLCSCFALCVATASVAAQDVLDRVDQALSFSAFDSRVRVRLSGTLDLELYAFEQPPPGLIDADGNALFNPRLSLFLDAQLGSAVYAFVQTRIDRGYDPKDSGMNIRLDEYAIRVTPWEDGRATLQVGKFATVVGRWVQRHLSWDNPFITAPLPYEYVTAISDVEAPYYGYYFRRDLNAKYEYNPLIWGPSYASGVSFSGRLGAFEYAAEMKNAALTSRPESWNLTEVGLDRPTFSGRVAFHPNAMWTFGVSASGGPYLRSEAESALPPGTGVSDYDQLLVGQDISFEWHHLQVWSEIYEARFEVPQVGNADTLAYFIEAKYKFAPQLFAAVRWNQQFFGDVPNGYGGSTPWNGDVSRIEVALGYRPTAHTQLKVQYNFHREEAAPRESPHLFAAQFTIRF